MNLRASILAVTITTLFLLTPCLAGEFGQTRQYFAQYGIGGPAETAFTIHHQGAGEILVVVDLISQTGRSLTARRLRLAPGQRKPSSSVTRKGK